MRYLNGAALVRCLKPNIQIRHINYLEYQIITLNREQRFPSLHI